MVKKITSAVNPLIKSAVKLHTAKGRKEQQRCIIEGKRAVGTAVTALSLQTLFCTEDLLSYAHALTPEEKIILVPESIMKKMSSMHTPSGLLGVFTVPDEPTPDSLTPGLVLAQVSDPGNMGTLLRTAVAYNLKSVVIIEGCDPWSPKVVQAAVGTNALVQIYRWSWEELIERKQELKLYGLVVRDGKAPSAIDSSQALLVIGNEARGIKKEWLAGCDEAITLPMPGSTESLNAAVAGSIATYLTFVKEPS